MIDDTWESVDFEGPHGGSSLTKIKLSVSFRFFFS